MLRVENMHPGSPSHSSQTAAAVAKRVLPSLFKKSHCDTFDPLHEFSKFLWLNNFFLGHMKKSLNIIV